MRWLTRSFLLALLLAAASARSASLEIRAAGPDGAPVSVSRAEMLLVAYGDVRTVPLPAAGSRVVADLSPDWLEREWPERAADVSKAYLYLEAGELAPLRSEAFDWLGTSGGDGEPVARTEVQFPRAEPVAVEPGADASVTAAFRDREPRWLRLQDQEGRPLAGVTVRAFLFFSRANHCGEIVRTFDLLEESGTGARTTDSAGRVRIPDGDFEVALLFEDLHLHALDHPDALPWPTPRLVTRLTEEETVLTFERFATRDVDLVVSRGGERVAGAVLTSRIAHCPCGACWGSLGTSDAQGVIPLRDFHPRRYDRVELRPAGRPFEEPALWSGDPQAWGPEPVLRVELPSEETP